MKQLTMSLSRHTHLKRMYNGNSTGIHNVLKDAVFDIEKDYSVGQDKDTGDMIFMQAEKKVVEKVVEVVERAVPKKKGKYDTRR